MVLVYFVFLVLVQDWPLEHAVKHLSVTVWDPLYHFDRNTAPQMCLWADRTVICRLAFWRSTWDGKLWGPSDFYLQGAHLQYVMTHSFYHVSVYVDTSSKTRMFAVWLAWYAANFLFVSTSTKNIREINSLTERVWDFGELIISVQYPIILDFIFCDKQNRG